MVAERVCDFIRAKGFEPHGNEFTAGELAQLTYALALDPVLLFSNLHGFNCRFDHAGRIYTDSPSEDDQLRQRNGPLPL